MNENATIAKPEDEPTTTAQSPADEPEERPTHAPLSITLEGDTLNAVKHDFNIMLRSLLNTMFQKGSEDGSLTLKLDVELHPACVEAGICYTPKFTHKVTTEMRVKNSRCGYTCLTGYMLEWDSGLHDFVMKPFEDCQVSMFEAAHAEPEPEQVDAQEEPLCEAS